MSVPPTRTRRSAPLLAAALLGLGLACASSPEPLQQRLAIAPPLLEVEDVYAAAGMVSLPEMGPTDYPFLHHVFYLSEDIISGAEPQGAEAFEVLADWGVKTVLSVDGKEPEHELAAEYGLDYVHIPIQYKGLSESQVLQLAKTFREKQGPFFVHCFHGKHRGGVAAALGRIVLDGASRERAIAEMRQYCSTSEKYKGLYELVASGEIPTAKQTRAFDFDFPPAHPFEGYRATMFGLARTWDNVKLVAKNDWAVDPAHPDLDPLQEATQAHQLLVASEAHQEELDFRLEEEFALWLAESLDASGDLVQALEDSTTGATGWRERANDAYERTQESCLTCHASYRNR